MRRLGLLPLAAASLALAASSARADSMQCDGGIVSVGDSKLDLLAKCGRPALVDDCQHEWFDGSGRYEVAVAQWTYNFGPNRFLQVATLVAGKVVGIERGGYGYPPQLIHRGDRARCDSSALRVGDGKLDLLAKCGEPVFRDSTLEKRANGEGWATVQVEVWTYDFGPQSFVNFATLENGKVVRVERGGYGYAR